jgi:tRNA-2-methylthio-N6-dimethylallyladenosine synthase
MTKKYIIETFGCQMNELDSEKIAGSFSQSGMEATEDAAQADVIVLNTCSVRHKAVQKVYTRLGEIRQQKADRADLIVCVAGCMAQLEGESILKRAPYLSVVAGPQKGHIMNELVERSRRSNFPIMAKRQDESASPIETDSILRQNAWRANVTISAFCVVPLARGKERTRESSKIIQEVESLASKGYVEIMLLGQTVNSYVDRTAGNLSFAALLRILSQIPGIKRIRFTSPHPGDFTDELLDVMVSCSQICNQIHLPVQSGYTREGYLEVIKKIERAPRAIAISTDLIVGYPGESESDFQDTLSLLDEVQYDSTFSFKYSPRPNTVAFGVPDDVSDEEKGRRLTILQEIQRQIQYKRNSFCMGQTMEVLVEEKARSRVALSGRTSNNKIVNFDGPETLIGKFVDLEITGFSPNSLKGVLMQKL